MTAAWVQGVSWTENIRFRSLRWTTAPLTPPSRESHDESHAQSAETGSATHAARPLLLAFEPVPEEGLDQAVRPVVALRDEFLLQQRRKRPLYV